jgi:regulator of protease activity HflC (stomatin/prohibitin superfamily)
MVELVLGAMLGFVGTPVALALALGLMRFLGVYTTVHERTCRVYVLFGNVVGVLEEPGLQFLWPKLGWRALIVNWIGKCHVVDRRLDQQYLRSQAVNSEEGAPMGIGVWYEMYISDPLAFLFKNADPRGSLAANVSNAVVRCLSNMKLEDMLQSRHGMSHSVREDVSPKSHEWGYKLGSVYIRKVHFRDKQMIQQIEEKVVNRLRQVTSAIKQDGANQVSVITSTAERQAAIEFAKAAALRPQIVGATLERIAQDPEVAETMFEVLEVQKLLESGARVVLVPEGPRGELVTQLLGAQLAARAESVRAESVRGESARGEPVPPLPPSRKAG